MFPFAEELSQDFHLLESGRYLSGIHLASNKDLNQLLPGE